MKHAERQVSTDTVQAVGAILGLIITTLFVVHPGPVLMLLFTLVAQLLFLIVGLIYLGRVLQELRHKATQDQRRQWPGRRGQDGQGSEGLTARRGRRADARRNDT